MKLSYFFVFLFLLFPHFANSAGIGFVNSSGIWFSSDPAFGGIPVKAYTVVLNNDYKKLTATIAFLDNGAEFARTTVDVLQDDARQITVIWTPTYGTRTVAAKFISATVTDQNNVIRDLGSAEIANLATPISRTTVIDNDSDRDKIGDHEEIGTYGTSPTKFDSDNDGLGDYEEIFTHKTNPNNPNTDGDNMNDGDEVHSGRNPLVKDDPLPPPPPVVIVPVQPQPKSVIVEAPQPKPTLNTETVQKKKPVATEPTKKLIPEITTTVTDVIETVTTTHNSAQEENTEIRPNKAANNKQSSESGNWVTVLGVIAALFASAAAVTGALAWREKNRY
jgi:hypothetical protein